MAADQVSGGILARAGRGQSGFWLLLILEVNERVTRDPQLDVDRGKQKAREVVSRSEDH